MGCGASRELPSEDPVVPTPSKPQCLAESVSKNDRNASEDSAGQVADAVAISMNYVSENIRNLELESILGEMPDLKARLTSVQKFNPDDLLDATSKPFSVLGYHMISGLAEKLGIDLVHLPQFVGTLGYVMKKQGREAQAARLLSLQFIEAQISGSGPGGGLLADWASENPGYALALIIAAMVSNDACMAKAAAGKAKNRSTDRNKKSKRLNESLIDFLSCTMFFRGMATNVRVELLTRVMETLSATDPEMLKHMLDNEKEMALADRDVLIMQATLLVATYSHVFRKFKVHYQWCKYRVEALHGQPMSAPFKIKFSLVENDLKMAHYAQAHSWFIGKVIAPFLQMWVRLTGNDSSKNVLCLAVQRMARTYDMLCDTTVIDCTQTVPVRAVLTRQASSKPVGEEDNAWQLFLDDSERSPVPADPVAVLSVCKMYGISSMKVLFANRDADMSESSLADLAGRPTIPALYPYSLKSTLSVK